MKTKSASVILEWISNAGNKKKTLLINIKITEKPKFIEYTINKFNITQKKN